MPTADDQPDIQAARRFAARAQIVLFNLLCVVVILLVVVNIPVTSNFATLRKDLMVTDESEIIRFRPNLREESYVATNLPGMGRDLSAIVMSTNNEGFRDRDHPLEKPAGTWRVAFVGDSFVFGLGVSQDETLPAQLERELNAAEAEPRWSVMNFGVPGLNFEGMGRLTQTFALKYGPDVVVYSFICDDVSSTDIITHRRWVQWIEARIGYVPGWLERMLVAGKMMRYGADFRLMKAIPGLYRKRVRLVLDYLAQLAEDGAYEIAVVDFCQDDWMSPAVAQFNQGRERPVHLLTDFEFEVLEEHWHPSGPSNARTVKLLAPIVRGLVGEAG